ncbi:hypothetical protein MM213_17410 [Belliella sp. R4-6]|uniref:Uncharacterized protein n=1 Tax=Belliella alkalica TaxID=1730871 RepID=A0ABS9VFQ8_9BACT|nr:hypothetical protein [Belliella alkalica]MCH7415282.1 hypothetical protein [Belliella alkalica]
MDDFLPFYNPYLLLILITVIYYLILIPVCFKTEFLGLFSFKASPVQMEAVFREYREWLELVDKLRPDQKAKAVYAIDNSKWLKKLPYREAMDLDRVWKDKIHREQLSNIKNQTKIS